jgi:hypothetical protein
VKKIGVFLITLLCLMMLEGISLAQELEQRSPPDSLNKAVPDVILVRPLAAIGGSVTASSFLVVWPFAYVLGKDMQACDLLIEKPWEFVSNRPLGVFVPEKNINASINEKINGQYSEFLGRTGADRSLLNLR